MMKMEIAKEEALNWIDQFEETKQWLGRFRNETTKARYAKYLMIYTAHTGLTPKQLIKLKQQQKNHEAEKLLDRFAADADMPLSTLRNISVAVKSFYKWNYEDLARACGRVSSPRKKPYRTPTQKELATFIIGANPRDKALILFMASTRIREETVTLLNWSHVWNELFEQPRNPPHIAVMSRELKGKGRESYNGLEQHTFLTPDAKDALLAYKAWREERTGETIWKESPLFTSAYGKEPKRICTIHIRKCFHRASKRTGLKFSAHDVGRFTQTQLENARIQPNWIKKITGHKIRGEENPYSRPKIEKLREAYRTAIPFLTTEIKEVTPEEIVEERVKEIEGFYKAEFEQFTGTITKLQKDVQKLNKMMEEDAAPRIKPPSVVTESIKEMFRDAGRKGGKKDA